MVNRFPNLYVLGRQVDRFLYQNDGFFDCELGDAAILAVPNIMHMGIVVFTSLKNYPVITIVPRNEPIVCTTVYLAFEFEQLGIGHYEAVFKSTIAKTKLRISNTKIAHRQLSLMLVVSTDPLCQCSQGGAKNKQSRQFCVEYKSGCKCFQSLIDCTKVCGCCNYANPYGVGAQGQNEISLETQVRKGHKNVKSENFIIARREEV